MTESPGSEAADTAASVRAASRQLTSWLLECAYPVWSTQGVDPVGGGFHERLTLQGLPTAEAKRARVQPRQVFAFARAPALGWRGDAAAVIRQGLEFFLGNYRRPDDLFRTLAGVDGSPLDERALLYDQAFALLAFATAAPLLGADSGLVAEGERLRTALYRQLKLSGPGFESGVPHGLPLLSNPHMHLLEAALAWRDLHGGEQWVSLADELGGLALTHLIDPATGMLHESFDYRWQRTADKAGSLVEPGHQFEWAWLLLRWGGQHAHVRAAARRLIDVAEQHGVHDGVAIMGIVNDATLHDPTARLWSQTERLRAVALAARVFDDAHYLDLSVAAAAGVQRYLQTPVPGLWFDRLTPQGELMHETVPAGNLYHIVGGIQELATLSAWLDSRTARAP